MALAEVCDLWLRSSLLMPWPNSQCLSLALRLGWYNEFTTAWAPLSSKHNQKHCPIPARNVHVSYYSVPVKASWHTILRTVTHLCVKSDANMLRNFFSNFARLPFGNDIKNLSKRINELNEQSHKVWFSYTDTQLHRVETQKTRLFAGKNPVPQFLVPIIILNILF